MKLSDILEKLQSKYPDDQDVQKALELAPEDEMGMEEEGMEEGFDLGLEEGEDLGMGEEEGVDDLGLPLPEGEDDMGLEDEEDLKKKKKVSKPENIAGTY